MSRATWAASWTRSWFSPNKPTPGWVSITTRPLAFHPGVIKTAFPWNINLPPPAPPFTFHSLSLSLFIWNINLPPAPPPLWRLQPRTPRSINGFLSFWFFRWERSFSFSFEHFFLIILSFNVLDANGLMQGSCFKNTKEITSLPSPNLLKTTKCHSFAPLDGSGAMFW